MNVLLAAMVAVLLGGGLSLALSRRPRLASIAGAGGVALGCLLGLVAAIAILVRPAASEIRHAWLPVLGGEFHIAGDSLSGFFLLLIFGVCGLVAFYGPGYLRADEGRRPVGAAWFFYSVLVVSMALVVTARNAFLFLVSWEIMALASFFLVTFEHDRSETRRAGRIYLIATHVGTAFLLVFMLMMAQRTGSLEFDAWAAAGVPPEGLAGLLFICALVGFGTKAGFMPLHIWLPEAHPAAPSHVSAVMSGVMIKMGLYGLLRMVPWLGVPPLWWGLTLVVMGLVSGILGALFAMAQRDFKRLLAYSSVENMGIAALALGLGMTGMSLRMPVMTALAFAGVFLHILNHAVFKTLLFLAAGVVYRQTHTREMDVLGGLMKRMPATATCTLIGCAAITALPPLNGFAGEFLIYWSAFLGSTSNAGQAAIPLMLAIGGLALIGGLAAACFAGFFGMVFLGEPRSEGARHAGEPAGWMRFPLFCLALLCALIGVLSPLVVGALRPVIAVATGLDGNALFEALTTASSPLFGVTVVAVLLAAGVAMVVLLRRRWLGRGTVRQAGTWDCGYIRPAPRMQYTASSFVWPLMALFGGVVRSRRRFAMDPGLFPAQGQLDTDPRDVFRDRVFFPLFRLVEYWLSFVKWLQAGRVQWYVLYIVLTLFVLLFWVLKVQE